jgi:hypothetical protein
MGGAVAIPFTQHQLLSLFERYNRAIEPAPFFAYALGAVALVFACRGGRASRRFVLGVLSLFWITCGAGFHLTFFRGLNPTAVAFGALFLVEAALLLGVALTREPPAFRLRLSPRHAAALALALYALAVYPRLSAAAGHGYPRSPVFGVAPCPTTIFTIAVLLLAEPRPLAGLLVVPIAWSVLGVSAALQLGMAEDYGLAVAGLVALAVVASGRRRGAIERAAPPAEPSMAHGGRRH